MRGLIRRLRSGHDDHAVLTGEIEMILRGPDGEIKDYRLIKNTVTAAGKNVAADRLLASPTLGVPTHCAVGTGTPGANALGTESLRKSLATKTRSTNVITMTCQFAAGEATGALTEEGIFDASSGGNMHLSQSYSVINKGANDVLDVTHTWTFN